MAASERPSRPHAVLFACGMNAVRSPIAAGLLRQMLVMQEIGIDISRHKPITFEELEDLEGLNFDLIVTLSPPAHHKALELTHKVASDVEYWPTMDPAASEGSREQRLNDYREVRDQLMARIRERFGQQSGGNE